MVDPLLGGARGGFKEVKDKSDMVDPLLGGARGGFKEVKDKSEFLVEMNKRMKNKRMKN